MAPTWFVRIHDDLLAAEDLLRVADWGLIARDEPWTWVKLEPNGDPHRDRRGGLENRMPPSQSTEQQQRLFSQLTATLPGERWLATADGLVRPGRLVPERSLPELTWHPIRDALRCELPKLQVAARIMPQQPISLRLVRGGKENLCTGLLTDALSLSGWIEYAPEARIRALRWVVASTNSQKCLVLGQRLPPISGVPLVVHQRILVPAGFHWQPQVDVPDLISLFCLDSHQWLLWEASSIYSTINDDLFMGMTRASVRQWYSSI